MSFSQTKPTSIWDILKVCKIEVHWEQRGTHKYNAYVETSPEGPKPSIGWWPLLPKVMEKTPEKKNSKNKIRCENLYKVLHIYINKNKI